MLLRVSSAEEMPLEDSSVTLITAGRAIQYFDFPKFFRILAKCDPTPLAWVSRPTCLCFFDRTSKTSFFCSSSSKPSIFNCSTKRSKSWFISFASKSSSNNPFSNSVLRLINERNDKEETRGFPHLSEPSSRASSYLIHLDFYVNK